MRVFILTFMVGIIPGMVLHFAFLRDYEQRAVEVRTEEVKSQLRSLANHLVNSGYMDGESSALINAELSEFSVLYDGRLLVINDHLRVIKDTYSVSEGKTIVSEDVIACLRGGVSGAYSHYESTDGYIETVTPIIATDSMDENRPQDSHVAQVAADTEQNDGDGEPDPGVRGVMLASVSTATIANTQEILGRKALKMELVMILMVFALALIISTLFVQPFEKLSRDIGAVRMGFSSDPVQAPAMTETEHIANSFNQVLARMNALDASRQEFVSNVSHELKTPMTSMKVLADSLLMEQNATPEMYREFLQDIADEIDRENKIISELLTLVRMDRKDAELNITSVDVNKMVEEVLGRIHPQARARGIELVLISERQVEADLDETKMAMVITNLVENAVKYNRDGGNVTVTIDAGLRSFTITVADTGIGIPEDALPQIFERFYRVDKSRSRAVGGTGLGLSIARSVVQQHHGTLEVESKLGEGTTFTMNVPILYVEQPPSGAEKSARRNRRRRNRPAEPPEDVPRQQKERKTPKETAAKPAAHPSGNDALPVVGSEPVSGGRTRRTQRKTQSGNIKTETGNAARERTTNTKSKKRPPERSGKSGTAYSAGSPAGGGSHRSTAAGGGVQKGRHTDNDQGLLP